MPSKRYALGLDYGTNSCRSLIVDLNDGRELATFVYNYPSGEAGILLDRKDPNVARQNPQDYLDGTVVIVKAALRKWPHVPHCYDWLALDARGHWFMRDERIQAAGPFPQVKGSRILHDKLLEFIHRNYTHDGTGAWFFQNGPQRVYVQLEAAPWVWRVRWHGGRLTLTSHTGLSAQARSAWLDEHGRLFLDAELGLGIVHSLDTVDAAGAVEAGACLLALTEGTLPRNPCLERVGAGCELDHVTASGRRLEGEYVLSNSFGFGGQNAALVFRRSHHGDTEARRR